MLKPGSEIAGYVIEGVLGAGGMGVVYGARQKSLNRRVALKLLPKERVAGASRERFLREGLHQAELDHPNVVPIYEADEVEEGLFIAMRLIDGPTLRQLIKDGELDDARTLKLLTPIADAIDAAHAIGLIHRDVKPHNILVGSGDVPFLADFGIAKRVGDPGFTLTGEWLGTPSYIAPEQLEREAVPRSDVYALGAVLYQCLTGSVPFDNPNAGAVLVAHVKEPPPLVTARRSDLPDQIDDVLLCALAKDPDERYDSAGSLLHAATRALTPAADETNPPPRRRPPRPRPRRSAWTRRVVLGVAVVAAIAIGYAVGTPAPRAERPDTTSTASNADLRLRFPAPWRAQDDPLQIPGLDFSDPISLRRPGGWLTAGAVQASGPSLLTEQFANGLRGRLPEPQRVRLGDVDALRYQGLRPATLDDELTVYAVPTSKGVATIACTAEPADCDELAGRAELRGAKPLGLEPSAGYATRVNRVLARLDATRSRALQRFRAAKTRKAQSAAANAVADTFGTARGALAAMGVSPGVSAAHEALLRNLAAVAGAYRALARAAADRPRSYSSARRAAIAAERRVGASVRAFRALGYGGV